MTAAAIATMATVETATTTWAITPYVGGETYAASSSRIASVWQQREPGKHREHRSLLPPLHSLRVAPG